MYFNLNIYDIIMNMKRDTIINTCIFISFIYYINYSVITFLNKNSYDVDLEEKTDKEDKIVKEENNTRNEDEDVQNIDDKEDKNTNNNLDDISKVNITISEIETNIKKELDKKTKLLLLQENLNSIKQQLENLKNDLHNNSF